MAAWTEARIEPTDYGFEWGGATVTRMADFDGTVVIEVAGNDNNKVAVYVSPTGRSVRVFKGGKEMKAVEE